MAFVCCTTWTVRDGHLDVVREALAELSRASRLEPGNLYYQAYQDSQEPYIFKIFHVYTDEAAYAAHGRYDHFQRWAVRQAIPVLESRVRDFYTTLDG
jgi:quinol monooxygenase YgiN